MPRLVEITKKTWYLDQYQLALKVDVTNPRRIRTQLIAQKATLIETQQKYKELPNNTIHRRQT